RSTRSLIQTVGRAARNLEGKVIMYADRVTDSMKRCIEVTEQRRERQTEYNAEHGITPRGIAKKVGRIIETSYDYEDEEAMVAAEDQAEYLTRAQVEKRVEDLRREMK